jgi:quercetin dioxygenase-like cupin family protein
VVIGNACVTPWPGPNPPAESAIRRCFADEHLSPHAWSNAPGDRYAEHVHGYHKVLYCLTGSIDFLVPGRDPIRLNPGDRLDLPPGTPHSALVGPTGVTCLEAARP